MLSLCDTHKAAVNIIKMSECKLLPLAVFVTNNKHGNISVINTDIAFLVLRLKGPFYLFTKRLNILILCTADISIIKPFLFRLIIFIVMDWTM